MCKSVFCVFFSNLYVAGAFAHAGERRDGLGNAARVLEDVDDGREGTVVRLDDPRSGQQHHKKQDGRSKSNRLLLPLSSSVTVTRRRHDDGGFDGLGYGRLNDGQHPTGGGNYRIAWPAPVCAARF